MGAPQYEQAGADIGGTGTTNTIPRWTGPSTLGDSVITQDGTSIGVRQAAPSAYLFNSLVVGDPALGNAGITLAGGAATDGTLAFAKGTVGNNAYRGYVQYSHTTDTLRLGTAGATQVTILSTGNVGIGTASPLARLHSFISGAAPLVAAGGDTISGSVVEGPNTALASGSGSLQPFAVLTNDTQAVDRGGGILFGGKWTNANNSFAYFGGVKAGKENSTSAEYGGYLAFYSRTNGATGLAERARIDSAGNFGINNASPSSYEAGATQLVVGSGTGAQGITIAGSSDNNIYFATSTSGANKYRGFLRYAVASDALVIGAGSSERARVDSNGNVVINTAAIATNATNGFLYVPSCAGTPTGTPTTYTGRVPIVVDTTNNKLYFYSGGAWRDAGP